MINKLAKAQKSWLAKLILTLTALSFMSLFGVTGYINSANNNRTVIKVDDIEVSQAQFQYLMQKELNALKNSVGENFELTDEMHDSLIYAQAEKLLAQSVLDRTAQKHHIIFRPGLIQSIIFNEQIFQDPNGRFNKEIFRRVLSNADLSEKDYIQLITRGLVRTIAVDLPVQGIAVPEVLIESESKVDNKRQTFKYVIVSPSEMNIDRQISAEETAQYYEDFQSNFIEPERRDLTVLYLPFEKVYELMSISDDEIQAYYEQNKKEYEKPQTRHVLQMIFDNKETADQAYEELQGGADFYQTAEKLAGQNKEETDMGYVAQDELVDELSQKAFSLSQKEWTQPFELNESWQILKIEDIKAAEKADYQTVSAEIKKQLELDRVYDYLYELSAQINDQLGAGETLEQIAQKLGVSLEKINHITEDGSAQKIPEAFSEFSNSTDFLEEVFAYNEGETTQIIETDNGLVVARIDGIEESHPKELEAVQDQVKALWAENEKTAIAQEILNDAMHDLENGDQLSDIAKRYHLKLYKSQPITRNETFANISYKDIREMFASPLQTPFQLQIGDNYLIVTADQAFENSAPMTEDEKNIIKAKAYFSLTKDLADAMLESYAKDYKTRVKYRLMGIEN